MLEIKNVTEMMNAFDGLNNRLDKTEERNSELEHMSKETSHLKCNKKINRT